MNTEALDEILANLSWTRGEYMKIKESGIILFTERYEDAVEFYYEKIGLRIRERRADLSILDFGDSYLMIERNGIALDREKTKAENPTVLRINVLNFDESINELIGRGLDVKVHRFNWGTIGVVIDPEGNRIEIKEA